MRASSQVIYRGMFVRLLQWLQDQGRALFDLDEQTLEAFLGQRRLHPQTRHRYLLFFMHLCGHLRALQPAQGNPARKLLLATHAPDREDPSYLGPAAVHALRAAVPAIGVRGWKNDRLQAIVDATLGAGLRSAELLSLRLDEVRLDPVAQIALRARAPRPSRRIPLEPDTASSLRAWMLVRLNGAFSGDLVFPADLAGKPLSASTLFRQVQACLDAAGIASRHEGPALLRNTCIARWLATHPVTDVQQWAGHERIDSTTLFAQAALSWKA